MGFAGRQNRKADGLEENKILYGYRKFLYCCLSPQGSIEISFFSAIVPAVPIEVLQ